MSLYDISAVSDDNSLGSTLGSNEPGVKLALREPRLLMYDIRNSLVPKVRYFPSLSCIQYNFSKVNTQLADFCLLEILSGENVDREGS